MDESSQSGSLSPPAVPIPETRESTTGSQAAAEPPKASETETDAKALDRNQVLEAMRQTLAADTLKASGSGPKTSEAEQKNPVSPETRGAGGGKKRNYEKIAAVGALVAAVAATATATATIYMAFSMWSSARQDQKWKSDESSKLDAVHGEVQKNFNESQKFQQESILLQRSSTTSLDQTAAQVTKLAATYQNNSPGLGTVEGASLGGLPLNLTNGRYEVSSFAGCPSLMVKLRGPSRGGNLKVEGGVGGHIFSCAEGPIPSPIGAGADRDLVFDLGDCLRSGGITECDGSGWLTVRVTR